MKSVITLQSLLFTAIILTSALSAPAEDWARWRGPAVTGHVPDTWAVPDKLPAKPKVIWRKPIGAGDGSPVVADGKVLCLHNAGGMEECLVLEAKTGKLIWKATLDKVIKDIYSPAGPRGHPLIDGDRLYLLSCRGKFQCLNSADGKVIWEVDFKRKFGAKFIGDVGLTPGAMRHGYTAPPFIEGDRMYMDVGGLRGASVVCFEKKTGKVIWKSQSDPAGHGGPVRAKIGGVEQLVSFTATAAIGLKAADGKFLWRVPVKTQAGRHCLTPIVIDDIVVVSSYRAGLIGIKVTKHDSGFTAKRIWTDMDTAVNISNPVAIGHHIFGLAKYKKFICVDVRTGKTEWFKTWNETKMKAGWAAFIVMKKKILVLTESGSLFFMDADTKEFKTGRHVKVCGMNWCHPAYAGGRLYLRDRKELMCLEILENQGRLPFFENSSVRGHDPD